MPERSSSGATLAKGELGFSIESRIIRELGERLVKQPTVALLEVIKNAYDADATKCTIDLTTSGSISIADDGHGMTLEEFEQGWMRIGTSAKEAKRASRRFQRPITGEKGIGRFAVRFLGRTLALESVAFDSDHKCNTLLSAEFDWISFDNNEDLGEVRVPYVLTREPHRATGTILRIGKLRQQVTEHDLAGLRTASIGMLTPYRALLREEPEAARAKSRTSRPGTKDAGFALEIDSPTNVDFDGDVADVVLSSATLRATIDVTGKRLKMTIYKRDSDTPVLSINDEYPNAIGQLYADIRFLPRRKGSLVDLPVDGRRAWTWVKEHSGIAVFDRGFRVLPYGTPGDDWLRLAADHAKRERHSSSSIAAKHFPMDEATQSSTQLNYMLRLPYSEQLVGVVQVEGRRSDDDSDDSGLVAAADREGFVDNAAYKQLRDVVRGAVEAMAHCDRELQLELQRQEQQEAARIVRAETKAAIREIEGNPNIRAADKAAIVSRLVRTQTAAQEYEERTQHREATLEVMSLLGTVAGFMTHEFGVAIDELRRAQRALAAVGSKDERFAKSSEAIERCVSSLQDFVTYSQGYVQGATTRPPRAYPARPRFLQVKRVFGQYADQRSIEVKVDVESDVLAPRVPRCAL